LEEIGILDKPHMTADEYHYLLQQYANEDRIHRERLERGSPTDRDRFNFAKDFNQRAADYAKREINGLVAYALLKMAQDGTRQSKWDWENPNTVTAWRPEQSRDGTAKERGDAFTEGGRIGDAEGRMRGGNPDHLASGRVEAIEPEWLTIEEMRTVAGIKARRW
jgi:hypothetical protein